MSIRRSGCLLLVVWLLGTLARPGTAQSMPPAFDPANGHWYQLVRVPAPVRWPDARDAARALAYAGYPGHLVTLTSAAEEQFVVGTVLSGLPDSEWWWMGGYQDTTAPDYREPASGWRWITGEPWSYTDWRPGQPDNGSGIEHFLGYFLGKQWNDFTDFNPGIHGYVVEFEPPGAAGAGSAGLVLFPNPVLGGQPALGQVTLAQPAGAGGEVLSLASSNPAATVVPASVTVPAGASSATFVITTLPVAAPTSVVITAACAFGPTSAALQVLPLPAPPPAAAGGSLLVNGSFEQPPGGGYGIGSGLPGWQILKGTVDVVTAADWEPAPDGGSLSVDLVGSPGAATIEQSFPTVPGLEYLFSGFVSHNPGVPYGRANVLLNGAFFTQLAHTLASSQANMGWQRFSYRFRATAAATTLTLSDVTGINDHQGTALDGLSVTLAPDQSAPVSATTTAVTPTAPAALSAQALASTQVALFWRDTSNNETAFAIWRRDRQHDWAQVGVAAPNATTYADSGLIPSTVYNYRVQAINGTVASDWSNTVTVRTPGGL